jgi:SPP1 family predicted phage head-tail adaptor
MRIGSLRHRVTVQNPSTPTPDGDGGFTQTMTDAEIVWAEIRPASAHDLERVVGGTVLSSASHLVRMRYRPAITTKSQLLFGSRVFAVTGVQNVDERNVELVIACQEVVA